MFEKKLIDLFCENLYSLGLGLQNLLYYYVYYKEKSPLIINVSTFLSLSSSVFMLTLYYVERIEKSQKI